VVVVAGDLSGRAEFSGGEVDCGWWWWWWYVAGESGRAMQVIMGEAIR
jgi:hypothetical protein